MEYELKRSNRKTIAIEVSIDGNVTVRAPLKCSQSAIDAFVCANKDWTQKTIKNALIRKKEKEKYAISDDRIAEYKAKAKKYLPVRTQYWSQITGLEPAYIHITSASKRFGSCNGKNGICFSYRLMAYPTEVIDYVILHELAHIKHKNHSKEFYGLIEHFMPDFKKHEKILKHKGDN